MRVNPLYWALILTFQCPSPALLFPTGPTPDNGLSLVPVSREWEALAGHWRPRELGGQVLLPGCCPEQHLKDSLHPLSPQPLWGTPALAPAPTGWPCPGTSRYHPLPPTAYNPDPPLWALSTELWGVDVFS